MARTVYPASGATIAATGGSASVTFQWVENIEQIAYRLQYKLVGAANWTTIEETSTATSKTVTLGEGEYIWTILLKLSADQVFPERWETTAGESTFSVYDNPVVTVVSPADSDVVSSFPIPYEVTFSDSNGSLSSGSIMLVQLESDGHGGYNPVGAPWIMDGITSASGLSGNITADALTYMPPNGPYWLDAAFYSSTTLHDNDRTTFTINIANTDAGTLNITNDPLTGYVTLKVGWDNSGGVHANHASLYRVGQDGTSVLLGDNLAQNATVVDKFAPLNVNYTYQVVTHAEPTAITFKDFTNKIATDRWFAIWDGGEKEAWAEWNPTGSYKLTRPQKKRVHYVGREYPVSYDGTALDETHSITFTVVDMDSWSNGFIDLMHDGGRGVYKSVDGKVFWADFEITNTPNYTSITKIGTVGIDITRIEGDAV